MSKKRKYILILAAALLLGFATSFIGASFPDGHGPDKTLGPGLTLNRTDSGSIPEYCAIIDYASHPSYSGRPFVVFEDVVDDTCRAHEGNYTRLYPLGFILNTVMFMAGIYVLYAAAVMIRDKIKVKRG